MDKLKNFREKVISWFKHFAWFIKESASFLDCSYLQIIIRGGIIKAFNHANYMTKWDNITSEQREQWYLNENRIITFE